MIKKIVIDKFKGINHLEITSMDVKNENIEITTINIVFYVNNRQILSKIISEIATISNVVSVKRS